MGGNDGMIPGSDWSMGLNSPTSVSQATVLASLGGKLRNLYADLERDEFALNRFGILESALF